MTAVGVRENVGPQTMADVERIYNGAWAQAHAGNDRRKADAEARLDPMPMTVSLDYCFRTIPGPILGAISVHIDWKEHDWGMETDTIAGKAKALLLKRWEQRHKDDSPEWLATLEQAVADNHGQLDIAFTPITANRECYYQTNSAAIARVIRAYMRSGEGDARYLYEVFPNREILVGTRRFPDDQTGVAAALAFMQETGGELKYVQKGTNKPYKASE